MRLVKAVLLAVSVSVLAMGTARADVTPHPIFSDNMVLQQGTEVVVWGTAAPGEEVNRRQDQNRRTARRRSAPPSR